MSIIVAGLANCKCAIYHVNKETLGATRLCEMVQSCPLVTHDANG